MKSPSYLWTISVSVGLFNNDTKYYELDISDTNQVRGLFLQPPGARRVGNYIEVPKLYGYKEIFIKPSPGESEYYLIDPATEEIVFSDSFTYKYTDLYNKPEIFIKNPKDFCLFLKKIKNLAVCKTVRSEVIGKHSTDDFIMINGVNGL